MFQTGSFKECVVSFSDDCQFTGKDCYVKSVQVNIENNFEDVIGFNERVKIPLQRECTITMEFVVKDFNWMFGKGITKQKVRKKKVEDCIKSKKEKNKQKARKSRQKYNQEED